MKILVTGSTGLVGSELVSFLKLNGDQVLKLVRTRADLLPDETAWDLDRGVINPDDLEELDAVVHLAGESIHGRWNHEKKQRIMDSRVKGTQLLCKALVGLKNPPKVLVSASAVGYYGHRGDSVLTEQSSKGQGFLADVCAKWEAATQPAVEKGIRVVNSRFGVVISPKGGILKQVLTPFKLCLGGVLGSGNQYLSWIAMEDLIQAIYFAIQNPSLKGPVNDVTPHPVTNKEFTKTLGRVLNRPTMMWMPETLVKMVFGEMADEMLLTSERVLPEKLEKADFKFSYPYLEQALRFALPYD